MTEEQKKETPQAKTEEAPKAADAKAKDVPKDAAKDKSPALAERPANCPVCNKVIKKKWYYRNNKYFCGKGCFKADFKKTKEAQAQAKTAEDAPKAQS